MRLIFRVISVCILLVSLTTSAFADHFVANCPLSFVGGTASAAPFGNSPHGVFRNGNSIYVLRGQTLTTLNSTETGEVQVAREDFISSLGARDRSSGVTYNAGYLFVSGEAGLEIFDLRTTRGGPGGTAPVLVSRTPGLHYNRMVVSGNVLAGIYSAVDLPCTPGFQLNCGNSIDLFSITNLAAPVRMASINSIGTSFVAFNDIAFVNGNLYATGLGGTFGFSVTNPAVPSALTSNPTQGTFLATNGRNLLAIGQETSIGVFSIAAANADLQYFNVFTLPSIVDRENKLMFHPEAVLEDMRLITMIDEKDPLTQGSARTIAFDVFDFSVPFFEGSDDRIYENVSYTTVDEVKYDPISVGPFVYVVGETSGTQIYGACGQLAGRIELDFPSALACGGAELRGWVTGTQRVTRVELFLGNTPLGVATLGRERTDISSKTPVTSWRANVNFDAIARGTQMLRAVATDSAGNRRQFASQNIFFSGPGSNCTPRKRGR